MVVGEGRPFIGALITLDPEALSGWAEEHHRPGRTLDQLRDDPVLRAEIQASVDRANAAVSRAESVRAWRLLDEPFNAIDSKTTAALLGLVRQWHGQQRTVIAVLHDDSLVRQYFPQTLLLARELVGWGATAEVLTEPHLQRARAMAEAWDEAAEPCDIDTLAVQEVAA